MAQDEVPALIIDNGSGSIKGGFSGQDDPSIVIPTVVGKPRYPIAMVGLQERSSYVGHEAQARRSVMTLRHPVSNGIITDWDEMIDIWAYVFQKLQASPSDHPILLTEAIMNPNNNREVMLQVMFEMFDAPAAFIAKQAALSLYAVGKTCGVVVDCGDGVTQLVAVTDGRDITEYLAVLLRNRGYAFTTSSEMHILQEIKEHTGYVAIDYVREMETVEATSRLETCYTLPDGQVINIGGERFMCAETLFQPSLLGMESPGIHEMLYKSIMKSDLDMRRTLFNNIILAGGTTMFPGMTERLASEIDQLTPSTIQPKIHARPNRDTLVWSGGAVLSTLSSFQENWITREEYEENGPAIVHRKCF